MICKNCNQQVPDGSAYCDNCGANLQDNFQQTQYQQPINGYQQPYQTTVINNYNTEDEHMSVLGWIARWCINLIPFVGPFIYLVMLFVWSFGSTPKKSLKTYARAQLILYAIAIAIVIIAAIIIACVGASLFNSNHYSYSHYYY